MQLTLRKRYRTINEIGAWSKTTPPTAKFDVFWPAGTKAKLESGPDENGWYILRGKDGSYAPVLESMIEPA